MTAEQVLKKWMSSDSAYIHVDDAIGAMQEYAELVAKSALKDASENAKMIEVPFEHLPMGLKHKVVDKKSILDTKIYLP